MAGERARGPFLTVMAILFAILTISNLSKAFQFANDPAVGGIVIFGVRSESFAGNLIFGPLMALVVGAYAYGLWTLKRWVLPLALVYAFYVPTNLVLFWYFHQKPEVPALVGILVYLAIAFTGSIGTALYLAFHRDRLT